MKEVEQKLTVVLVLKGQIVDNQPFEELYRFFFQRFLIQLCQVGNDFRCSVTQLLLTVLIKIQNELGIIIGRIVKVVARLHIS